MFKLSENEKYSLYANAGPSELTDKLLADAMVPGKKLRIEWPWAQLEPQHYERFLETYVVTTGLVIPEIKFDPTLSIHPVLRHESDEAAQKAVNALGAKSVATAASTRSIYLGEKIAGQMVISVLPDFHQIQRPYLSWLWIDSELTKPVRHEIAASLAKEACAMVPGPLFGGIYAGNIPLLKVALHMQCKSLSATFTRRQSA
jgi:hypothetical protein